MSFEAWRISFQDSEQAAKAAFEEAQRYKRMFNMSIDSIVELTEAVGIRKEDQTMGGTVQTLAAIEKLKARRDKWKARALEAEQGNRGEPSPSTTLALRDVLQQSIGMEKAALFIEQKANSYNEEHGDTDPSTGHREYPGDGEEYYNELMELAEELRLQANGGTQ